MFWSSSNKHYVTSMEFIIFNHQYNFKAFAEKKNIEFVNIYVILYHAIAYHSKYKKGAIFVKYEMRYYNGPKAIKN